jgi:hypothetical protein
MHLSKNIHCLAQSSDPQLFGVFQLRGRSPTLYGDLLATLNSSEVSTSEDNENDRNPSMLLPGFRVTLRPDGSAESGVRLLNLHDKYKYNLIFFQNCKNV